LLDSEKRRTGTKKERKAGARAVRERLEEPYKEQLAANAPAVRHPIEITQPNPATIFMDAGGVDLGPIPASVTTRDQLIAHLAGALSSKSWFGRLFAWPTGEHFVAATFDVFFRNVYGRDGAVAQFTSGRP